MNDKELIRMLKAEIQDLQDQLAGDIPPAAEFMDDLNLSRIKDIAVNEAVKRSTSQKHASELLGVDRGTLTRIMKQMGLKSPDKWRCNRREQSSARASCLSHWKKSA
jgi:DNA-binding protein Fis